MIFGNKHIPNTTYQLVMNSHELVRVNDTKFLGVYIDEKLNWKKHQLFIGHCSKKRRSYK